MKILQIKNINQHYHNRTDDMDLINVLVEYDNGSTGNVSMYRARYDRQIYQENLMKKYNIPESDINILMAFLRNEFDTDHFYDNEE